MSENEDSIYEEGNKYLKAIHQRFKDENPKPFSIENKLPILVRYLARTGASFMYLSKEMFEELYPLLKDILIPEKKVTLVVEESVLDNEKLTPQEQLPFKTEECDVDIPPRLSNLLNQDNIFIYNGKYLEKNLPSFFLFDNKSYIVEISDDNHFICSLNAHLSLNHAERLDKYYYAFSKIKHESTPFKNYEMPRKITSNQIITPEMPKPFIPDFQRQ